MPQIWQTIRKPKLPKEPHMSPFNKKLNRIDGRLAAYATLAGAALAAPAIPSADATIIYSGPVAINIPSTTAGVYLNVVTACLTRIRPLSPAGM